VIEGLVHGKERAIELLRTAIRFFEEKMQDDSPKCPSTKWLEDYGCINWRANSSVSTGLQGVQATGGRELAGNIRVSIKTTRRQAG
jgi:hypothetical protein